MFLLNIFQNTDGTTAWDNILILLVVFVAGYLLNRFSKQQNEKIKQSRETKEWENKFKKLDTEVRAHQSAIHASEKQAEKSLGEMTQRVKALEGDIRALSDEKNKYHHQLLQKEEENKQYSRQLGDLDEQMKSLKAAGIKSELDWTGRLQQSQDLLAKASVWESRVRTAEDEAQKARAAIGQAERKKLEAELRLKAVSDYASKVVPLELELQSAKDKLAALEQDIVLMQSRLPEKNDQAPAAKATPIAREISEGKIGLLTAELELQKNNHSILKHELTLAQMTNQTLQKEIEDLKHALKSAAKPEPFMAVDHSLRDSMEAEPSSSL